MLWKIVKLIRLWEGGDVSLSATMGRYIFLRWWKEDDFYRVIRDGGSRRSSCVGVVLLFFVFAR